MAKAKRKASTPLVIPDALGDKGRAALAAEGLLLLQRQARSLENTRLANGHELEDGVPADGGGLMLDDAGTVVTYAARLDQIQEAQVRLTQAHEGLAGEVASAIEQLQARL